MLRSGFGGILGSYCYGPADLIMLHKGDSTMWLTLVDSAGRRARAVYRGCVYWRLDRAQMGSHFSLVQKLSADELLQPLHAVSVHELEKNALHVDRLLHEWEDEGLSFYIHLGGSAGDEFLVVAESLEYSELN